MAHQASLNIYVSLAYNTDYHTIANLIKWNTQHLAMNKSNYLSYQTLGPPDYWTLDTIFLDSNPQDTPLEIVQPDLL